VLRNHGLLTVGRNVAEAFSLTYYFEHAARAQLKMQAAAAAGRQNRVSVSGGLRAIGKARPRATLAVSCRSPDSANGRLCCGSSTSSIPATAVD